MADSSPQRIEFDDTEWPLLVIQIRAGDLSMANVKELCHGIADAMSRKEGFAMLVNSPEVSVTLGREGREYMHNWIVQTIGPEPYQNPSVAIVTESALLRGLLTGIMWMRNDVESSPQASVVVATFQEGRDWCLAQLSSQRKTSH